jgi:hypothetical protein
VEHGILDWDVEHGHVGGGGDGGGGSSGFVCGVGV